MQRARAKDLYQRGNNFIGQDDYTSALPVLQEAERLSQQLSTQDVLRRNILHELGLAESELGHLQEGEQHLRQSLEIQRSCLPANHSDTALTMAVLGACLRQQQKLDESEQMLRQAVEMQTTVNAPAAFKAMTMWNLGACLHHQQKYDEAERMFRQNLEIQTTVNAPAAVQANALDWLMLCLNKQGKYEKTEEEFLKFSTLEELPQSNATRCKVISSLEASLRAQGKLEKLRELQHTGKYTTESRAQQQVPSGLRPSGPQATGLSTGGSSRQEESQVQQSSTSLQAQIGDNLSIRPCDLQLDGQRLGGTGSFGVVQVGHWRGVPVAVKTFHSAIVGPRYAPVFRRELVICSQMHHPHIINIYGAVLHNGTPLQLVMELLQGSMADLMDAAYESSHYLSFREQIDLAAGSVSGINYMHQLTPRPYLHCDIRSTNIMVTRDMVAKVGDFGASHVINSSTSIGPLSGEYLAPERMPTLGGSALHSTLQSDVYSLGVTLVELFIGVAPIPEERQEQVEQISNELLQDMCKGMIARNPATRPAAAECLDTILSLKQTQQYKELIGRRLVRGLLDDQKMSIDDSTYV